MERLINNTIDSIRPKPNVNQGCARLPCPPCEACDATLGRCVRFPGPSLLFPSQSLSVTLGFWRDTSNFICLLGSELTKMTKSGLDKSLGCILSSSSPSNDGHFRSAGRVRRLRPLRDVPGGRLCAEHGRAGVPGAGRRLHGQPHLPTLPLLHPRCSSCPPHFPLPCQDGGEFSRAVHPRPAQPRVPTAHEQGADAVQSRFAHWAGLDEEVGERETGYRWGVLELLPLREQPLPTRLPLALLHRRPRALLQGQLPPLLRLHK